LITSYFENNSDIFFYCDTPVAIAPPVAPVGTVTTAPVEKQIFYETLKNYSFYESGEMWVKILFPLNGVHNLGQDKFKLRFL